MDDETSHNTSGPVGAPVPSDFLSVTDFIGAHESFHDARTPSAIQTLERAARLASNSIFAIRLQLARVRTSSIPASGDVSDAIMQRWTDSEFLIIALWRLRTVACIAASVGGPVEESIAAAIERFDNQVPHLKMMRHVSQHLDDYAIDHPRKRRQHKPNSRQLIGRRLLEVTGLGDDEFHWLRGKLNFADAEAGANALYQTIRKARDSLSRPESDC